MAAAHFDISRIVFPVHLGQRFDIKTFVFPILATGPLFTDAVSSWSPGSAAGGSWSPGVEALGAWSPEGVAG